MGARSSRPDGGRSRSRDPAAERLRQTAARYRSDAGDQPRADFRDAVSGLSQALLPHLRGEEDEAMPLVAAVLTEAEWRHWDQAHNVKGKSLGAGWRPTATG